MNSFFNKISDTYKHGTSLMQLIYINIGIFVIFKLTNIILILFNIDATVVASYMELPSNLTTLLYQPWSLITQMFFHIDFFHIFFNMIALYWFGKIALEYYSQKQLVALYILGGLSGALLYIVAYNTFPYFANVVHISHMLGASGAVLAICTAASIVNPNRKIRLMFIGEIKLIWLAAGMVIISLFGITGNNAGGEFAHIGGAILGYLFGRSWQKGKDWSRPITAIINWLHNITKSKSSRIGKVKFNSSPRPDEAQYNRERKVNNEYIDKILDKIKRSGYESLTGDEKRQLFDRSKKNY